MKEINLKTPEQNRSRGVEARRRGGERQRSGFDEVSLQCRDEGAFLELSTPSTGGDAETASSLFSAALPRCCSDRQLCAEIRSSW